MSENEQNQSSSDEHFLELWTTLRTDENYAGLADYVMQKNGNLQRELIELRNSVYDIIPQEARESFDLVVEIPCHPPPGCDGFESV